MTNFEMFLKELVLKFFSMNELPAIIDALMLLKEAGHLDKLVEAIRHIPDDPVQCEPEMEMPHELA